MRLSVQLYTLRDDLSADVARTLTQLKDIGLEYVELAGTYDKSAAEWKTLLDENGLKVSGSHIGIDALKGDLDAVIADAKVLGFRYVILPWVNPDTFDNDWSAFGESLRSIAEKLKENGLVLCYHNHDFEYKNGDGLADLYKSLPADLLQAEVDAAWVKIGGYDPIAVVKSLSGRVPCVHGKDYDPAQTPRWRPAGQGVMPLDELIATAQAAGTEFLCIELDESPGAPIDAVRESYKFYAAKGLC